MSDTARVDPPNRFPPASAAGSEAPLPWYRRRAVLLTAGIVVVLAVTVISDLPVHASRAQEISTANTVMSEVNSDVASCAFAAHEALTIWAEQQHNQLSNSDLATAPSLLRDDQAACSLTNESIFTLSNTEVPGSAAGKHLTDLVSVATLWVTSDAIGAIKDVQALLSNPADKAKLVELAAYEQQAASDLRLINADTAAANRILHAHLPAAKLPVLLLPPVSWGACDATSDSCTGPGAPTSSSG
jgi:hypothetical protein